MRLKKLKNSLESIVIHCISMRHRKTVHKLERNRSARKALLRQFADQLVMLEKMQTTESKAKAIRPYVEKLITHGKKQNLASRRLLAKYFTDQGVKKIVDDLAVRYKSRHGGYIRITKLAPRSGDAANMVRIELV